jgi:hypothetical protein
MRRPLTLVAARLVEKEHRATGQGWEPQLMVGVRLVNVVADELEPVEL